MTKPRIRKPLPTYPVTTGEPAPPIADCTDLARVPRLVADNEPIDFAEAARRVRNRKRVRMGPDLKRVADEAISFLSSDVDIFDRGGVLVRIVRSEADENGIPAGTPRIRPTTSPTLREHLSALCEWQKHDKRSDAWIRCAPPAEIAQIVLDRGAWPGVRRLVGVLESPALRSDGTIIDEPGWDRRTGYFYMPNAEYPSIPDRPTAKQVATARDELLEVVCDFPFAEDHGRSVWLALVMTPLARPAIDGCVPLILVDANVAGAGKSKQIDAASVITSGREAPRTTQPEDDAEWRKRITSIVVEGCALMLLDNILRPLGGESIDALLTARVWKDRILGRNETVEAPCVTVWAASGNNVEIVGDTTRRTLRARIDAQTETPEDREGFRHPDLLGWLRAERPRLVSAALTILRAHAVAGRPMGGVKVWGSFEAWSRVVAAAIVFAGLPDPQMGRLRGSDDPIKGSLGVLFKGWLRLAAGGITAKGAIEALYPPRDLRHPLPPDDFIDLREAIETLCPPQPGKPPTAARLGAVLRRNRKRVLGNLLLDTDGMGHGGVFRWVVRSAPDGGDGGDGGPVPNPSRGDPSPPSGVESAPPSPPSPPDDDEHCFSDLTGEDES